MACWFGCSPPDSTAAILSLLSSNHQPTMPVPATWQHIDAAFVAAFLLPVCKSITSVCSALVYAFILLPCELTAVQV